MQCEEHNLQSLLYKLDEAIALSSDIDRKQRKSIEKSLRMFDEAVNDKNRYEICVDLFSQYKKYNLDSMFIYAKEGWLLAKKMVES